MQIRCDHNNRSLETLASIFAKIYGTESSTKDVNVTGNAPPGGLSYVPDD